MKKIRFNEETFNKLPREEQKDILINLRAFVNRNSTQIELAGDAAAILSNMDIDGLRISMASEDYASKDERGQYSHNALMKLLDLADEWQQDFKLTSGEKYGPRRG